jgi:CBS domain-containing protein
MKNILVSDVMTREPVSALPNINLLDCAKIMVKKKVGSVLLVKDKKLVGFISEKDILLALIKKGKGDLHKIKAVDVSARKIAVISPFANLMKAIEKMKTTKFDRLPVIQKGELVGVITKKDILNFHPELYPELDEFEQIREESEKMQRFQMAKKNKRMGSGGICEECGRAANLQHVNGALMCNRCAEAI